jgi:hypothetical protein
MFPGLGGATPERAWFGWGINDPVHGRNGTLDSERRHVAVINLEILRRAWGEEKVQLARGALYDPGAWHTISTTSWCVDSRRVCR